MDSMLVQQNFRKCRDKHNRRLSFTLVVFPQCLHCIHPYARYQGRFYIKSSRQRGI